MVKDYLSFAFGKAKKEVPTEEVVSGLMEAGLPTARWVDPAPLPEHVAILPVIKQFKFRDRARHRDLLSQELVGSVVSFSDRQYGYLDYAATVSLAHDPTITKTVWDGKNLYHLCGGIAGVTFDVQLAQYLLQPMHKEKIRGENVHTLQRASYDWFKNRKTVLPVFDMVDQEVMLLSCHLLYHMEKRMRESLVEQGMESVYFDIELPLSPVLAEMEEKGVALDVPLLNRMTQESEAKAALLRQRVYQLAGREFNLRSTQELSQVLFEEQGLPKGKRTKKGYSTDVKVLDKLREQFPIVDALLQFRASDKLTGTYTAKLPGLIRKDTGRLHCHFNQAVCVTGRLSSSEPNLQNIPIRGDEGKVIRGAFTTDIPGWVIVKADYSQIELRVLAHYSQDPTMLKVYREGTEDIHTGTARTLFGLADNETPTKDQRRMAKIVNFAIPYGTTPHGLSEQVKCSVEFAATELYQPYLRRFSRVNDYMANMRKFAHANGYVQTLLGRRRPMPNVKSLNQATREAAEREAINMPIQGTAADIMKLALLRIKEGIVREGLRAHMLMQVHDEIVLECHGEDVNKLGTLLREAMVHAYHIDVPLDVEIKFGPNWGETEVWNG